MGSPPGTWTRLGFGSGVALQPAPGGQTVLLAGQVLAPNESPLLLVSLKNTPGATVASPGHSQAYKVAGQSGVYWWVEMVQDPGNPANSLADFFVENFQVDATVDWVAYKVLNP